MAYKGVSTAKLFGWAGLNALSFFAVLSLMNGAVTVWIFVQALFYLPLIFVTMLLQRRYGRSVRKREEGVKHWPRQD